ncbi:head decoration protein [Vreelandella sp.]|uniref:head decoration protein n=1 Tax=Vreelandella sp. TaxID=3137778 RepID=UPI003BAC5DB5
MPTKTYTEGTHTAEHLLEEANPKRSREQGVLAAGNHVPGTVLALNADGNYVQLAPAATNGTEKAVAVLYSGVDATTAPQPCVVHARDCTVHGAMLTWPAAATEEQIATGTEELAEQHIIIRD